MFKKIIFIITCSLLALTATANDTEQRRLAEEMLVVSHADAVMEGMMEQVNSMFAQAVQRMNVPEDKQAQVEKYMKRLSDIMFEEMSWAKMKEQFIDVYVEVFSEEELKELIAFYQSPLGQKLIAKMPQLMEASMTLAQRQMQAVVPRITALAQEMEAELYQAPPSG